MAVGRGLRGAERRSLRVSRGFERVCGCSVGVELDAVHQPHAGVDIVGAKFDEVVVGVECATWSSAAPGGGSMSRAGRVH